MPILFEQWKLQDFKPGEGREIGAQKPEYDDSKWLPVQVPGDVTRALIEAGRIPDPFIDRNEDEVRWMEEREWWFRAHFKNPSDLNPKEERLLLAFEGLDTYAVLYLNGNLLGRHQNMFSEAVFDVTNKLKPGDNLLAVRFDPPLSKVNPDDPFKSWWGRNPERVYMRKAQFGYGWDWGPRLPTIGIWRPVELVRHRIAALLGVQFATLRLDRQSAGLLGEEPKISSALVMLRISAARFAGDDPLKAEVRLTAPGEKKPILSETIPLNQPGGLQDQTVYFSVPNPTLWWTHDIGQPFLYDLRVQLRRGKEVLDSYQSQVGIRTLSLDQSPDPDEPGTRFFRFVLNDVPIFARGANWIPADSFVGAIPPERYENLLSMASEAHMNMLRVWGGGIYEHDLFYELCDRLGMLVWQDFMFACAMYPENDAYAVEVEFEARFQVKRLRNHPSLALWCGNNENQWIHDRNNPQHPEEKVPGSRYYDQLLPDVVSELDGITPYWPGSPYGGNDYNSMTEGDLHDWRVWHGGQPRRFGDPLVNDRSPEGVSYRHYAEDMGRFISEFGMHAAPVLETLKRVIPEDQLYHHSPAMDHHNKDNPKNKGDNLMQTVTGLPDNLDEYIDFSMIAQAEGLKFGIEHFRQRKPHCSGALIWQLNDCWPVLSWSLIDYYGFGKAGYFYTQRVFAPVMASFKLFEDGGAAVWLTNDCLQDFVGTIQVRLAEFDGDLVWEKELGVDIPANTSLEVFRWDAQETEGSASRYLWVSEPEGKFPANRSFFTPIKDLQRQPVRPEMSVTQVDPHILAVDLSAAGYAYFVHLTHPDENTRYSDNYFDMQPGEQRVIWVSNQVTSLHPDDLRMGSR